MAEEICDVECVWAEYLKIGGKIYWENDKVFHNVCQDTDRKLPSDSKFREDVCYWNLKDVNKG